MTSPLLSICIPTYNFGAFIGETLKSIFAQWQPGVEVVVLDSASTDDTQAVVHHWQSRHESLRYMRAAVREGIDRDMSRVVDLALGEYCWLFSADDIMAEGALARALDCVRAGQDLVLAMHSDCDVAMRVIKARHPIAALNATEAFELSDATQLRRFLALALTTEALFSFMGGLIVRRAKWQSLALNEVFVGSCWAHVARLFELMPSGLCVHIVCEVWVHRRGDNDSFATQGVVRRYALAILGYQQLAQHFWGFDHAASRHVRRILRNEFDLRMFLFAKVLCAEKPEVESRQLLDQLFQQLYGERTLFASLARLAYRGVPVWGVAPARQAWRLGRKALRRVVARTPT